jgi:hypothetical protein
MAEFSFAQIEAILAAINNIADHKRTAFAGRLKTLQKNKILDRKAPGRGKAAAYSFNHLVQLGFGIELMKAGLAPNRAANLVRSSWSNIRVSAYLSTFTDFEIREMRDDFYDDSTNYAYSWVVRTDAFADLTVDGFSEYDDYEGVEAIESSDLPSWFDAISIVEGAQGRRVLVINATALVHTLLWSVEQKFKFADRQSMRDDIQDEHDNLIDLLNKFDLESPSIKREKIEKEVPFGKYSLTELIGSEYARHASKPVQAQILEAKETFNNLSDAAKQILVVGSVEGQFTIDSEVVRKGLIELIEKELLEAGYEDDGESPALEITSSSKVQTIYQILRQNGGQM